MNKKVGMSDRTIREKQRIRPAKCRSALQWFIAREKRAFPNKSRKQIREGALAILYRLHLLRTVVL